MARPHGLPSCRASGGRVGKSVSPGYDLCPSVSSVAPVLTLARTNASIEAAELSRLAARRMRPDRVSQYFAFFRLGLAWLVPTVDHLDGAGDKNLPRFYRIEKAVVDPERDFALVDLRHALQRLALGIAIVERRSFCASSLVGDAEPGRELQCGHAIGVGCHQMHAQNHTVRGNLERWGNVRSTATIISTCGADSATTQREDPSCTISRVNAAFANHNGHRQLRPWRPDTDHRRCHR